MKNYSPRIEDRFWPMVEKTEHGCWLFASGRRNKAGYGRVAFNKKYHLAHRVSWKIHHGEIPVGLYVLHKCDVPGCVNPDHLYLGTHLDNVRDMVVRGRCRPAILPGETHPNSKLKNEDVMEIRRSALTAKQLAEKFCITRTHVYYLRGRQAWKHLP